MVSGACLLQLRGETGVEFLGATDRPPGLPLQLHTFVVHKGDYDKIADDVPQKEQ